MSKISKENYQSMTDKPDNIQVVVVNNLGEGYASESLLMLHKSGSKVKSQFAFKAERANEHPLSFAFLYIDGEMAGSYKLKPPITDISTVSALNMEWEI